MKNTIALLVIAGIAIAVFFLLKKKPETVYQKIETGQPDEAKYSDYSGYFHT
jgi:hypothetical protein